MLIKMEPELRRAMQGSHATANTLMQGRIHGICHVVDMRDETLSITDIVKLKEGDLRLNPSLIDRIGAFIYSWQGPLTLREKIAEVFGYDPQTEFRQLIDVYALDLASYEWGALDKGLRVEKMTPLETKPGFRVLFGGETAHGRPIEPALQELEFTNGANIAFLQYESRSASHNGLYIEDVDKPGTEPLVFKRIYVVG